jgi:hypothetical protein
VGVAAESFAGTLPAIQRTSDHHYIYQGVTYPGVTKALGVLDKSGPLMVWAAKNAAEAAVELHTTMSTLTGSGLDALLQTVGREGTIKALADRANWKRDEAAQLGTDIHHWADQMITGQPLPALSDTAKLYTDHYAQWWSRAGWKLRLSEAVVLSPSVEGVHGGYGGTFDLLCYDADGRTVLADIKTGKGVYREAILQLAAYGAAELVSPMGSQSVYPMPAIDRYVVIHVTRDGVREVELSIGSREWTAWWACLDLYAWTETVKGRL